jgi:cis-3,4-dihydrophenanthrene-3,4-diol dehydrogenase
MGALEGDVAYITGGAAGIGLAVTRRFLHEGASVVVLDANPAAIAGLETHSRLVGLVGDVTSWDAHQEAVDMAIGRFGRLDTVVANAGITDGFASFAAIDGPTLSDVLDNVARVNVTGAVLAVRAALGPLVSARGSAIFTLSIASHRPGGGGVAYTASTHALLGAMRQLAFELAPHVRVNGVAPGGTVTDIRVTTRLGGGADGRGVRGNPAEGFEHLLVEHTPLATASFPEDHADAFVFLASRRSSRITTGAVINTDAGLAVSGLLQVRGGDDLLTELAAGETGTPAPGGA